MYSKYYQLQVLYTLLSPILGQIYLLERVHTSCTVCTVVFMLVESRSTHLMMRVRIQIRIQIGLRITTVSLIRIQSRLGCRVNGA